MEINFAINIMPIAQARPRFFLRHAGLRSVVGAYDPKKCKQYKEAIAWHAKREALIRGILSPLESPMVLTLTFKMGLNKKEVYHTKRPDIDNLAKAVKDALRGIIYHDDSQIVEAHLFKQYGEPGVIIEIKTLEG